MSKGILKNEMEFPAVGYSKLNGYLGLVGLNRTTNEFYISSKSSPQGPYADMVVDLVEKLGAERKLKLKNYLKANDVTLVFEVIKYKEDPHIIKYDKDKLILLSIVENTINFKDRDYEEVIELSNKLNLECKEKLVVLNNWEEFKAFYKECMKEDIYDIEGEHIEGLVIECENGFIVKLKMPYYNYWKKMRGTIERYKKGNENALDGLQEEEKQIVEIGVKLFEDDDVNIIDLLDNVEVKSLVKELSLK